MNKVKFVFGIHNHQPVGNFDFVFEEAFQKSYLPFLETLESHPKIRIAIHFTGILLDWLEIHHPELLQKIKAMVSRGQLEVMSGAYYEPIISVIPEKDRQGQINKLSTRVEQLFGYKPRGMWLAERIWEPHLPSTLSDAGMQYTVIDDTHFKYAGLTDADLNGYFITEDCGKMVSLFPINKELRYTIPFQDPQNTLAELKRMATAGGENVIVFADDGEKFGVWPDTYKHVYENGWLESFFTLLEDNLDWIEMLHFSEVLDRVEAVGKIYLPTASYAEMMEWSLFTPSIKKYVEFEHIVHEKKLEHDYGIFVRGGFWRNFMVKYPEINIMHKKMMRVSERLWNLPQKKQAELQTAFDQVWAAQCNCPYWHGVFGGSYLSHLRFAIFKNLLDAEKQIAAIQAPDYPVLEWTDFDLDGKKEVLVETEVQNAYFKPDSGAALFLYEFKPVSKNLSDNLSRREEGYHSKLKDAQVVGSSSTKPSDGTASIHDLVLAKEEGLMEYLNYDWYARQSFVDHFLGFESSLEDFEKARYKEQGDFVNQPYRLLNKQRTKNAVQLVFERSGHVWTEDAFEPLVLRKTLNVLNNRAQIDTEYELINKSGKELSLRFAVEFNYGLQAGHAHDRYYYDQQGKLENGFLDSRGTLEGSTFIGLKDEYLKIDIALQAEKSSRIWRCPVETISLSEAGFERVYQSSSVLLIWDLKIKDSWKSKLRQKVETY